MTADAGALPMIQPRRQRPRVRLPATALFGVVVVLLLTGAAICAPLLAPTAPDAQVLERKLLPPLSLVDGQMYWAGTDTLGRDLLSRLLFGAQVSLLVAVTSTVAQTSIGTLLGLIAGYRRGFWDALIMRVVDIQLTIPYLALAIAVVAILGPSLFNVILVLTVTSWVFFARMVRAEVLTVRELAYVEAARSLGSSDTRLLLRHILPNVANTIIVLASFQTARTILSEATLSFLGLGVQPPTPTWGNMVADGRNYLSTAWWICTVPGIAISLFVLASNLLGNWLRDRLDPTRRNRVSN